MVQRADINSVLSEIRNLRAQMMQNQRVEQEAHVRGGVDRRAESMKAARCRASATCWGRR